MAAALAARAPRGAKWWLLAAGLAALAAPLLWVGLNAPPTPLRPAPATAGRSAASTAGDATLEALLARADHALAAGQLAAPPGASAADLYREALRRNARDPRAVNGLEQILDGLVSDAESALQDRHLQDAQALADQAHAISPDHPRVAFLMAQIGAQRERLVLDKAQHAAATGNVAGALAALDDARRGGRHSTLVEEARQQLAQQQVDERVAEFLRRGREALLRGQLIEPPAESARSFIESARALAPGDVLVQQATQELSARLQAEAGRGLTEARAAGADAASIEAVETTIGAAQDAAQRASSYVSASSMTRTRYVAPLFPPDASRRGIDGWVDLQFAVNTDGSVGELTIVGAQPVGIFEQAALDAVRHWHYQPVMRDGRAVSQRARVRVRFAMER